MDKLLDKAIHQLYKAPSLTTYLSASQTASAKLAASQQQMAQRPPTSTTTGGRDGGATRQQDQNKAAVSGFESDDSTGTKEDGTRGTSSVATVTTIAGDTHVSTAAVESSPTWQEPLAESAESEAHSLDYLNLEQSLQPGGGGGGARLKTRLLARYSRWVGECRTEGLPARKAYSSGS